MDSTPMTAFLSSVSEIVTQIFTWIGTVCTTIVGQPLLLFTVGFLALGGAIGLFGRMLSRN